MESGIYQITNTVNGNCYIGSSKYVQRRKQQHFNLLRKGKNHSRILQRAFTKYGESNFTFKVLAYCPVKYLFKLEQWFVDTLKPKYNICIIDVSVPIGLSGQIGYEYTEEHKEQKRQEAFIKLETTDNFGWKSRTLEKLDGKGNILQEYNSLKEYALEHNCSIANVGKALKRNNKCKGFYIRYK